MYSIGITTFKRRLDMVSSLIETIRKYRDDIEILLAVNADYEEPFDQEYRKEILQLAARYNGVYPIVYPIFTGLAKMWNNIIINASSEYILLLNDDIDISEDIFVTIEHAIFEMTESESAGVSRKILKINDSFSHFIISKELADDMGYFDERLLAFGEEDGDFVWRYIRKYGKEIANIDVEGISNLAEGYFITQPNMETEDVRGMRLVPSFNRKFIQTIKYRRSIMGIKGMFDHRMNQVLPDEKQYPYEKFRRDNYSKIGGKKKP